MKHSVAAILAAAALTSSQTAHAQSACVAPDDLNDAIVYAMPLAYDAARTSCAGEFADNGFMATGGADFVDGFRQKQDAAWPGAFRLLQVFMAKSEGGNSDDQMLGLISSLPESSLRPFVDAIVTQKIGEEIKPDTCGKIERAMELMSPLPVENVSGLITFIAEQSDLKNPELCKANARAATPSSGQ
ncbi:MAG: hypothetical protein AAFQ27_05320 [Pseudomonadota bacterium]